MTTGIESAGLSAAAMAVESAAAAARESARACAVESCLCCSRISASFTRIFSRSADVGLPSAARMKSQLEQSAAETVAAATNRQNFLKDFIATNLVNNQPKAKNYIFVVMLKQTKRICLILTALLFAPIVAECAGPDTLRLCFVGDVMAHNRQLDVARSVRASRWKQLLRTLKVSYLLAMLISAYNADTLILY